jgi:hypothetical protein
VHRARFQQTDARVADFNEKDVKIEVMTKNNYRVKEWENGAFRARVSADVGE